MNTLKTDFQREVIESPIPVLVDFSATWCGPCRTIEPHVEAIATELQGKAKVVKVDVDEHSDVASKYGIMSIPALLVFKNGQEVDRLVGAAPKDRIAGLITKHL
jgi:thioredoxin 1